MQEQGRQQRQDGFESPQVLRLFSSLSEPLPPLQSSVWPGSWGGSPSAHSRYPGRLGVAGRREGITGEGENDQKRRTLWVEAGKRLAPHKLLAGRVAGRTGVPQYGGGIFYNR